MKVPGIYVEIRGDFSKLSQDLNAMRAEVKQQGRGISDALSNALNPKEVKDAITGLTVNIAAAGRAAQAAAQNQFSMINAQISNLAQITGVSEKEFAALQSRMLQFRTQVQAEKAFDNIAKSVGLATSEVLKMKAALGDVAGAVTQAFKTLGVRSESGIVADIKNVVAAYKTLATSGQASSKELAQAHEVMRQKVRDLALEYRALGVAMDPKAYGAVAGGSLGESMAAGMQKTKVSAEGFLYELDKIQKEMAQLPPSMQALEKNVAAAAAKAKELGAASGLVQMASAAEKATSEIGALFGNMEKIRAEAAQLTPGMAAMEKNMAAAVARAKELGAASGLVKTTDAATRAVSEIENLHANLGKIKQDMAQLAATNLEKAFGTLGATAPTVLKARIVEAANAYKLLRDSGNLTASQLKVAHKQLVATSRNAAAGIKRIGVVAKEIQAPVKAATVSLRSMLGSFSGFFSGIYIAYGVKNLTSKMLDVTASIQGAEIALKTVTGSEAGAAKEMQFLRDTAQTLGLDLLSTVDSYKLVAAAALKTKTSQSDVRDAFVAVSEAAVALGLKSEDTKLVLLALSQMISKGTVYSEELRRQLGDRLPGAFQIAAEAMGVTTAELSKMLQQGKIATDEFLPKFSKVMHERFSSAAKDVDLLVQAQNRVSTAWTNFFTMEPDTRDNWTTFLNKLAVGINKFSDGVAYVNAHLKDMSDKTDKATRSLELMDGWGSSLVFDVNELAKAEIAAEQSSELMADALTHLAKAGDMVERALARAASAIKKEDDPDPFGIKQATADFQKFYDAVQQNEKKFDSTVEKMAQNVKSVTTYFKDIETSIKLAQSGYTQLAQNIQESLGFDVPGAAGFQVTEMLTAMLKIENETHLDQMWADIAKLTGYSNEQIIQMRINMGDTDGAARMVAKVTEDVQKATEAAADAADDVRSSWAQAGDVISDVADDVANADDEYSGYGGGPLAFVLLANEMAKENAQYAKALLTRAQEAAEQAAQDAADAAYAIAKAEYDAAVETANAWKNLLSSYQSILDNVYTYTSAITFSELIAGFDAALASVEAATDFLDDLEYWADKMSTYKSGFESLASSISSEITKINRSDWSLSDYVAEYNRLNASLSSLNTSSDTYYDDALEISEDMFDVLQSIEGLQDDTVSALKDLTSTMIDIVGSTDNTIASLMTSDVAPSTSMEYYLNRYSTLYNRAATSLDSEDVSAYESFITDYLNFMSSYGGDYQSVFDSVIADLGALQDAAGYDATSSLTSLYGVIQALAESADTATLSAALLSSGLATSQEDAVLLAAALNTQGISTSAATVAAALLSSGLVDNTTYAEWLADQLVNNSDSLYNSLSSVTGETVATGNELLDIVDALKSLSSATDVNLTYVSEQLNTLISSISSAISTINDATTVSVSAPSEAPTASYDYNWKWKSTSTTKVRTGQIDNYKVSGYWYTDHGGHVSDWYYLYDNHKYNSGGYSSPTYGYAYYSAEGGMFSNGADTTLIGEKYPEAAVPLTERHLEPFMRAAGYGKDNVAQDVAQAVKSALGPMMRGSGQQNGSITVKVNIDGREIGSVVASQMEAGNARLVQQTRRLARG